MTVDDVLRETKGKVRGVIPPSIDVSDVEFEGALVVIYTKHPDKFAKNEDIVRQLAKMLQRRIAIRPDPSVITDTDTAERKIKNIVPKDAELTNIYFLPETGEVTIEVSVVASEPFRDSRSNTCWLSMILPPLLITVNSSAERFSN